MGGGNQVKIIERLKELRANATPGPWSVGPNTIGPDVVVESNEYTGPVSDADARLIVEVINALPALLEAAEAAENMATVWYSGEEKTGFNARDCMIRQRAAIEKLREVNTK